MKKMILLLAALPCLALAQQPPADMGNMPDMGQLFLEQMDIDKDGKVTLEEFRQPTDEKFRAMDFNKDGVVTAEEARNFARMMIQRMQQMQRQMMQQQPAMPRQ
jgi:Ca2+-binding EF-hand superfamily protein